MTVKSPEKSNLIWARSKDGVDLMLRKLSNTEQMFTLLNDTLFGQNCPFIGATVSLRHDGAFGEYAQFDLDELVKRVTNAFCQTRWKYPTVAAQIRNGDTAVYNIESEDSVKQWAQRTVTIIQQDGGWPLLREQLSRESSIPTKDGDSCVVYVIVRPEEIAFPQLSTFDVLFQMHHALTDGSGIRSILNEFLTRLGHPLSSEDTIWGQEVERLYPPSVMLEKQVVEGRLNGYFSSPHSEDRQGGLFEPDVGLPVYRLDILQSSNKHKGTLVLSHTFEEPTFLPRLLTLGRQHGVKLTALLQAAMLRAVYNSANEKPAPIESYKVSAAADLRTSQMVEPFNRRNEYVNSAVSLERFTAPCKLFENDDIWPIATHLAKQWSTVKSKQGSAKTGDKVASALIAMLKKQSTFPKATLLKPQTCPYYISDPPGSAQLEPVYVVSGNKGLVLVLESYQLATDQNQAVVSARSHSWNGRLTLCLAFNAIRNPKEKMQEFLGEWVRMLEIVSKPVD